MESWSLSNEASELARLDILYRRFTLLESLLCLPAALTNDVEFWDQLHYDSLTQTPALPCQFIILFLS
jgi:hypothetical protein